MAASRLYANKKQGHPPVLKVSKISYLPPAVDINHLSPENGKLLSEEEILKLRSYLPRNGRYSKSQAMAKYTVIVQDGKYFAVYKKELAGAGKSARVKFAQDLETGKWVALKVQPPMITPDELCTADQESKLLAEVGQAICVGAQPVAFERYSKSKEKDQHYMLMKLGKGEELFDFVSLLHQTKFPCITSIRIAKKIISNVGRIHTANIIHRDVKLENIRYEPASGKLLLIDFGYALHLIDKNEVKLDQRCGTACYAAPEIFTISEVTYNRKIDIYSLGVTLAIFFDLAYKNEENRIELFEESSDDFKGNKIIPDYEIRKEILNVVKKMLDSVPDNRPEVQDLMDFFCDIENKLVKQDKTIRVAIIDASEFCGLKDVHEKNEFIAKLRDFNEVWLTDSKENVDLLYYVRIRRELEVFGINVSRRLFHGLSSEAFKTAIPAYMAQENPFDCYEYSHVKVDKTVLVTRPRYDTSELSQLFRSKTCNQLMHQCKNTEHKWSSLTVSLDRSKPLWVNGERPKSKVSLNEDGANTKNHHYRGLFFTSNLGVEDKWVCDEEDNMRQDGLRTNRF